MEGGGGEGDAGIVLHSERRLRSAASPPQQEEEEEEEEEEAEEEEGEDEEEEEEEEEGEEGEEEEGEEEAGAHSQKTVASRFDCSICLELVYKPIVHSCGHIFCFWCVHYTMDMLTQSHCPLCRRAFMHFPRICEQLHFFLSKALPKKYEQRARKIKEKENKKDYGSPVLAEESISSSIFQPKGPQSVEQMNLRELQEQSDLDVTALYHLLCKRCNRLLYKPVILNCGHVFCQFCIKDCEGSRPSCSICQFLHPSPTVLVCLELDQYLEAAFPVEYSTRHQDVCQQETRSVQQRESSGSQADKTAGIVDSDKGIPHSGMIHVGVGCDACGMMPIIGRRFKCKDCLVSIGFDLCNDCYLSGLCQIGRFNQKHSNDHRVEEVIPLMIISGPLENPLVLPDFGHADNSEREEDADSENQPS